MRTDIRQSNIRLIRTAVDRMQRRGIDVSLRNANHRYGLDSRDGSRTISPLLPARELLTFIDGFAEGFNEGHHEGRKGGLEDGYKDGYREAADSREKEEHAG